MATTQVGSRTHVGLRRSLNEDAVFVGRRLWVVADGMGGHAAGDVASSIVIERVKQLDESDHRDPADVVATVLRANQDVLDHAAANPTVWGLGTTVAGVCEVDVAGTAHWAVFNVGDSRVYRFIDGQLSRATVDHSETEELVLAGQITEEEARHHHLRNVITRSVGATPPPQVDLWVLPQTPGETFLICSDGLTSELDDAQIAAILREHDDPQDAVDLMTEGVLEAGARDNVSVVVVEVMGGGADEVDDVTNPRMKLWDSE